MKGPLFVYDNPLVGLPGAYLSRLEPDGSNPVTITPRKRQKQPLRAFLKSCVKVL